MLSLLLTFFFFLCFFLSVRPSVCSSVSSACLQLCIYTVYAHVAPQKEMKNLCAMRATLSRRPLSLPLFLSLTLSLWVRALLRSLLRSRHEWNACTFTVTPQQQQEQQQRCPNCLTCCWPFLVLLLLLLSLPNAFVIIQKHAQASVTANGSLRTDVFSSSVHWYFMCVFVFCFCNVVKLHLPLSLLLSLPRFVCWLLRPVCGGLSEIGNNNAREATIWYQQNQQSLFLLWRNSVENKLKNNI